MKAKVQVPIHRGHLSHTYTRIHICRGRHNKIYSVFGRGYSPLPTALAPVSGTVEIISSGSGDARVGMQNYCHTLSCSIP